MPRIPLSFRSARFPLATLCAASLCVCSVVAQNESIAKKDRVYANADMVDLGADGAYFKDGDDFEIIPWSKLSRFQVGTIRNSFQDALRNLRLKAYWVDAEVFQVVEGGGVVVTAGILGTESEDEKKPSPDHKRGAEVLKNLVYIKDYTGSTEEGAPVETHLYESGGTFTYDIGFGIKELKIYTIAKPDWAKPSNWSDSKGRTMLAELIEVHDGNCRFLREGKEFLFPLAQLKPEDQERALKQKEYMRVIPLPEG